MKDRSIFSGDYAGLLFGVATLSGLYLTSLYSFLFFHSIAEIFSIVVACGIFFLAWNTRRFADNGYLLFVGIAYLFVAVLDLIHTLAYKGMGVFTGYDANLPTQLWIAARYLESLSLLAAPWFLRRKVPHDHVFVGYLALTSFLLGSIFFLNIFPTSYVEGVGLTPFKIVSEYVISLILVAAIALLYRNRKAFEESVFRWLVAAVVATIGSELAFTTYVSVFGFANVLGHLLKITSFYLVYKAIIQTGLQKPYELLFRDLKLAEERYRHLFDNSLSGFALHEIVTDPEGHPVDYVFLEVNRAFEELTGLKARDIVGKRVTDVLPGVEDAPLIKLYGQVALTGTPTRFEQYLASRNRYYDIAVFSSSPDQFAILFSDITERKRAEDAEREQRALAEALIDTAAGLNSTLDLDDLLDQILDNLARVVPHDGADVMLVDQAAEVARIARCHGYSEFGSEEAMLALTFTIADTENLREMAKSGRPFLVADTQASKHWIAFPETRWICSNVGAPIRYGTQVFGFLSLHSATPHFFTSQHAERLQAFADQAAIAIQNAQLYGEVQSHATDLEARVAERTAELQAANEELEALGQLKDEFVANVSHELRTPITNIKLYHSLIALHPGKQDSYLTTLNRETRRLEQHVEDLLYLTRQDRGEIPLVLAPTDLNGLARVHVVDFEVLAESRNLTLTLEEVPNLPTVFADEDRLGRVLSILLNNALTYVPKSGQVIVKTMCLRESNSDGGLWAGFSVSDTGPGIALDEQEHVFERFVRGKVGRESGLPGTGLGLAIAKDIVDRHKGRFEVISEGIPGQGATFNVWLPVRRSDD